MRNITRQTRTNRTITIDFQDETTYFQALGDGKASVELVMAFILSISMPAKALILLPDQTGGFNTNCKVTPSGASSTHRRGRSPWA
jgi:hypothetical protein